MYLFAQWILFQKCFLKYQNLKEDYGTIYQFKLILLTRGRRKISGQYFFLEDAGYIKKKDIKKQIE